MKSIALLESYSSIYVRFGCAIDVQALGDPMYIHISL